MQKYYEALGWMSPDELVQSSIIAGITDSGTSFLLASLAVVRMKNSMELEEEFVEEIQKFLRKKVQGYDDAVKRGKAEWN